jgi:hypothetical protein
MKPTFFSLTHKAFRWGQVAALLFVVLGSSLPSWGQVPLVPIAGGDVSPNFTFTLGSMVANTVHVLHSAMDLEQQVENARIYARIHYHHSVVQGVNLGRKVSEQGFREFYALQSR